MKQYDHLGKDDYGAFIKDTRISTENVVHCLRVEETTPVQLADAWDVELEAIQEAKQYESH